MFRVPKSTMPVLSTSSSMNPFAKQAKEQRQCSYLSYECNQPCLESYAYCIRHILEDPNAPYKQCCFIYNYNGRKCTNAAPKGERKDISYCAEHTRTAQVARTKSTAKHSLPECPETLLLSLKHYVRSSDPKVKIEEGKEEKFKVLDPFDEIDAAKVNAKGPDILDCASSSDSDVEPTLIGDTVKGTFLDDSDNDSLHSADEDPLRHAGVYTAEEVVYVAREKLMRLQSLYVLQFKRLQYLLREKRRTYLHALKKEKETLCSIHNQKKDTAKERKLYEKLKALNCYHRRSGVEAVLYKKWLERRAQATGPGHKHPSVQKCIFTEGGVKCGERTLPSAKYCRKHILKDTHQVLFKACGAVEGDDTPCHEPVPVVFDETCVFHQQLPPMLKLEPVMIEEEAPSPKVEPNLSDTVMDSEIVEPERQEIDPDDDMAGIMREMNDVASKKSNFNESINSEASTDTAFSLTAQLSDKDDLMSM